MSDVDVTMPQLGETVAEGTVSRWLYEPGAQVTAEEPLLEVSTDKVDTEVLAPASGTLKRILVPEGETVPVGTVLAQLGSVSDAEVAAPADDEPPVPVAPDPPVAPAAPVASAAEVAVPAPAVPAPAVPAPAVGTPSVGTPAGDPRHRDSPRVRRLAQEHDVDLDAVARTGPHGRATPADVLAVVTAASAPGVSAPAPAVSAAAPAPASSAGGSPGPRVERLTRRRRVIAERMHRSLLETAQLTTVIEVDLGEVVRIRDAVKDPFKARYGASLSVLAFVAEAAVRSLAEHPIIHAELDLDAGTVTHPTGVDLGIAVDTPEGLVVPVIRGANDLNVGAIARRIADLARRTRDGSATADDFAGGSFTITNTGSRGALFDTPILNHPQSAILGLGAAVRRPVAVRGAHGDELIAVRPMAYLSLTYDHRLIDGADAARYLGSLRARLETPGGAWADILPISEGAA